VPDAGLLAFPFHDWRKALSEGFRTRDGHLLEQFAGSERLDRLAVVNRPVSLLERAVRRQSRHVAGRVVLERSIAGHVVYVTEVGARVVVIDFTTPDFARPLLRRRGWWFEVFRKRAVVELLKWAVLELRMDHAPVIAWIPTVADVIAELQPRRFVYDSLDNWLIHPMLRRHAAQAAKGYASMLPTADAVFVSAPASAEALARWRSNATVLPNGVDPEYFAAPHPRPLDLPPAPVVGYAGKLAHRIDAELVREVARSLPDLTFVFIGPVLDASAIRAMRATSNVRILGDRHYSLLPSYLQHFDVAWIPHRVGEGETGGDPIKLYEYWAAGCPVVSTPIDGLGRWGERHTHATTTDEMRSAIRRLLQDPVQTRVPSDRTWAAIADRILASLLGSS
jgi:glycosyltransferase involved in cell wall biosynthesis